MSERMRRGIVRVKLLGLIGSVPAAAYIVGVLLVQAVSADTGAGSVVNGDTLLPLGLVAVGIGVIWRAATSFQRMADKVDSLEGRLDKLPCVRDGMVCGAAKDAK